MGLYAPEEKNLKREFTLENAKKHAVRHFKRNLYFRRVLIVITGQFQFLLDMVKLL